MRGGDKYKKSQDHIEQTDAIWRSLQLLMPNWIVITDDQRLLDHFPDLRQYYIEGEKTMATTIRDFSILCRASLIVQHSTSGWSAFSHVAALVSGAPIINTDPTMGLLNHFIANNGLPVNFFSFDQVEKVIADYMR